MALSFTRKPQIEQEIARASLGDRVSVATARQLEMESLNYSSLDRIGLLLCHAASAGLRARTPIERDIYVSRQSEFERSVFGTSDGDYPASFQELPS